MSKRCAVPGCLRTPEHASFLMCRPCWRAVPHGLRRGIYRLWAEVRDRGAPREQRALALTAYRGARDQAIAIAERTVPRAPAAAGPRAP